VPASVLALSLAFARAPALVHVLALSPVQRRHKEVPGSGLRWKVSYRSSQRGADRESVRVEVYMKSGE